MGCSAEQAYNQTMFLLQPFDAMMVQLNWTIGGLQQAARNISRGLRPLADGLDLVEKDLYNGKLQLYGTRKVSRCTCLALYWPISFTLTCLIHFNQVSIAMYVHLLYAVLRCKLLLLCDCQSFVKITAIGYSTSLVVPCINAANMSLRHYNRTAQIQGSKERYTSGRSCTHGCRTLLKFDAWPFL